MSRNLIDELECEKSHSGSMRAAAKLWMDRALEAERTLALVVFAAGGAVEVSHHDLVHAPEIALRRTYMPHNMAHRFEAKVGIPTIGMSE